MSAARQLVDRGVGAVLATLGAAGAVLVNQRRQLAGHPATDRSAQHRRRRRLRLAGYLRADVAGAEPPQRLQMAVAYGSAAAALPGSALPRPPRSTSMPFGSRRFHRLRPDQPRQFVTTNRK